MNVHVESLTRPEQFETPFGELEYVFLLVTFGVTMTHEETSELCRRIVTSPCRYAVCWGHDCERWHDLLDHEFVMAHLDVEPPLMMTTWHPNDPVREVVWFLKNCTAVESFQSERLLVLFVGRNELVEEEFHAALTVEFGAFGDK